MFGTLAVAAQDKGPITNRLQKEVKRSYYEQVVEYTIDLDKGARDRSGEENMVSGMILNALAAACGLKQQLDIPLLDGDRIHVNRYDLAAMAQKLYRGEIDYFGHLTVSFSCS